MTSDGSRNNNSDNRRAGQPQGSMIGVGIAIGTGLGVAIGVAFDNLALGIAIGAAIGVAIGAAMEQNRGSAGTEAYGTGRTRLWVVLGLGLALLLGFVGVYALIRLR